MTTEIWLSLIAIVISVFSIILQYTVEGPKIELLNADDKQLRTPRYHKELPESIQKTYPEIPDYLPGYALVRLVFGNSGDRAGIASIKDIKVRIKDEPYPLIKASYFNYALIPAYGIVEKEILLKNLDLGDHPPILVEITLTIEYGGYHPRTGKTFRKETVEKTLRVSLMRGDEQPWLIS